MKKRELTEAERTMLQELGAVVIVDRLKRAMEVGTTKKGRVICVFAGQPTEAELAWERIREEFA